MTDQQQLFVDYYCGEARGNAADAARQAGYKNPKQDGWRLKQTDEIRAAIDERLAAETLTQSEILAHWTQIAALSVDDFYVLEPGTESKNGLPGRPPYLRLDLVGAKQLGLLKSVKALKMTQFGFELQLFDPERARENIARAIGVFKDAKADTTDKDADRDSAIEQLERKLADLAARTGKEVVSSQPDGGRSGGT